MGFFSVFSDPLGLQRSGFGFVNWPSYQFTSGLQVLSSVQSGGVKVQA